MFSAAIFANGLLYGGGTVADKVATIELAKEGAAKYLNANKTSFQQGYDVYIIDRSTGKIVSSASQPVPSLNWQDAR